MGILLIPQSFYYPEHVGLKIGTNNTPRYVVMEIHYDNPDRRNGMNTNFRNYLTTSFGLGFRRTSHFLDYARSLQNCDLI